MELKEFVSDEMVAFCTTEKIVLQVVVTYNHTMQAKVEGAIGYVKQHSRVSMLAANVPTRWWPQATTDFVTKKNFLWYSTDASCPPTTARQRMQPAFAGTQATVAIPFGSRIVSTVPLEHRLVVKGSFGDRFVEGTTQRPPFACMILALALKSRYRISNHTPLNFLSEISRALCGRH